MTGRHCLTNRHCPCFLLSTVRQKGSVMRENLRDWDPRLIRFIDALNLQFYLSWYENWHFPSTFLTWLREHRDSSSPSELCEQLIPWAGGDAAPGWSPHRIYFEYSLGFLFNPLDVLLSPLTNVSSLIYFNFPWHLKVSYCFLQTINDALSPG